jgi:hypothetical protein
MGAAEIMSVMSEGLRPDGADIDDDCCHSRRVWDTRLDYRCYKYHTGTLKYLTKDHYE